MGAPNLSQGSHGQPNRRPRLNVRQRVALAIGLALFAFSAAVPPWNLMNWRASEEWLLQREGYAPFFKPPYNFPYRARIAWDQLSLTWVAIGAGTLLAVVILGFNSSTKDQDEERDRPPD